MIKGHITAFELSAERKRLWGWGIVDKSQTGCRFYREVAWTIWSQWDFICCNWNFSATGLVRDRMFWWSETSLEIHFIAITAHVKRSNRECLRYAAGSLDLPLTALFNYVFDTDEYPDEWAEGIINPIHKKGPIKQPDRYHKITFLNALGILFDTVLNTRLKYMRQSCDEEDPFQKGFKDGRCTIDI